MLDSSKSLSDLSKKFCRNTELDLELAMQMKVNPKQEYEKMLATPSLTKCLNKLTVREQEADDDSSHAPDIEPVAKSAKHGESIATSA